MTKPAIVPSPFSADDPDDPAQPGPRAEVLKISGSQGLVAAIPYFLGFTPTESLVLLCLQGPRKRMGPVLRLDLPARASSGQDVADYLAEQAAKFASGVALMVYTEAADQPQRQGRLFPHAALIGFCMSELRKTGVPVFDAMLIRGGLVWSYLHHGPTQEGFPIPGRDDPQVDHLHSANVGVGRAVLSDRVELALSIAGPVGIAAGRADEQLRAAASGFASQIGNISYQQALVLGCRIADERLAACWHAHRHGRPMAAGVIADLIAVMGVSGVRDSVISWGLERISDAPLSLFIELARWTPDEFADSICVTLAAVAYRSGDGALANVALDRALAVEPDHKLAQLLVEVFNSGIHPTELDMLILDRTDSAADRDTSLRMVRDQDPE